MRLVFSDYTGDKTKLSLLDKECLTAHSDLWIEVPMSPAEKGKYSKGPKVKRLVTTLSLRSLLTITYPGAVLLHQIASESVKATGHYPISKIVRTTEEDKEDIGNDDPLVLDDPKIVKIPSKRTHKVIIKPIILKKIVGQFQPRVTLTNTIKGRRNPTRVQAMGAQNYGPHISTSSVGVSPNGFETGIDEGNKTPGGEFETHKV